MKAVLKKAAITSGTSLQNGGLLNRAQQNQFVNLTTNYSRFLQLIRVMMVTNKSGQIDKLDFASPISRAATEAAAYTDTRQPTFSKVLYDCVKMVSAYDLSTDAEEDNIEGAAFRQTVLNAFMERLGLDWADLAINGDSSLGGSDVTSLLRKTNDGLHILTALAPNYVDANGLGVSLKLFKEGLNKMPERYRGRLAGSMKWFIGSNPYTDFMYEMGTRATAGGDSVYGTAPVLKPFGIAMEEIPMFPKDLTIGTAATDGSFIILTDPRNLMWIVRRSIQVHFFFQARSDLTEVTAYTSPDFLIENLDALVKIKSLSVDASTSY